MHANKSALVLLGFAAFALAQPQATQHGIRVTTTTAQLFDAKGCIGNLRTLRSDVPAGAAQPPFIEFETWVERLGEGYAESVTGGCARLKDSPASSTLDHYVADYFRETYVSYSVTVDALPRAGEYRVTFAPSNAPIPADIAGKAHWKVVSPASFPLPQVLREGDWIPLDLVAYPKGIHMVDYIHIGTAQKMTERADAARDFYAEDAELTLARPKLRVNGGPLESVTFPDALRGPVLWIYVPNQGRYILTLAPHADFEFTRAGEVSGGTMTLLIGRNLLRISSGDRITPGGGVYNVYGTLDRDWIPADPADRTRFMAGTSPGVETAVGR